MSIPFFLGLVPLLPPLAVGAASTIVGTALAYLDAYRTRQVFGYQFAHPLLALLTPVLYLVVRLLRDRDLRAGKPLWIALALAPLVIFFEMVAALGAYGMAVHGYS